MARPKKDASGEEKVVIGDYLSASYILDNPPNIVKVSPAVDLILGGGWPEGTIGILESPPKVGKTTLALKVAAKAQQQLQKTIIYSAVESRLAGLIKNLKGVLGLDTSEDKFKLIASSQDNIYSTEQFLEKSEKALIEFPGSLLIFDSFSALSSSKEKTGDYGSGYGGIDSRKLEGEFARRVAPIVSVNNSIVIGIAHITPNINSMGNSTKLSRALMYQLDIRLNMKKCYPQGDWMSGNKLIGQKVAIECLTSALGSPGGSCNLWLKYGQGFLDQAEVAEIACDLNIINKAGAGWYSVEEEKVQGFDKLCTLLKDNSELYKRVLHQVQSTIE